MAYSSSNPPRRVQELGWNGKAMWMYESADPHATVEGAGYFSDGTRYGLKIGDLMYVIRTGTVEVTIHRVTAIAAPNASNPSLPRAVSISAATLA